MCYLLNKACRLSRGTQKQFHVTKGTEEHILELSLKQETAKVHVYYFKSNFNFIYEFITDKLVLVHQRAEMF